MEVIHLLLHKRDDRQLLGNKSIAKSLRLLNFIQIDCLLPANGKHVMNHIRELRYIESNVFLTIFFTVVV